MTASTAVGTPAARTVGDTRVWWGVAAAIFAIAWGGNEFTPLLVMYKNDGLSVTTVNVLLFDYVLGIVPALLIGGPLSDRYGRRRLMRPAPVITAVGSTLLAFGSDLVPMLSAGRVLCGIGLGLAMAVGSSWVKELSQPPFAPETAPGTGARRSAMSLTAGFAVGAGLAGVLAQWAPLPSTLAYLINVVLCLFATVWVFRAPETVAPQSVRGPLRDDLRIPAAGHRRFRCIALPLALWVFSSAATAYAILPTLASERIATTPIAFSALITVVTLGCGFAIQSVARRIDVPGTARIAVLALVLTTAGMLAAVYAAATLQLWAVIGTAAVLGFGFGIAMVAGLQEIERIARPDDLAGLTAVFYSVCYLGFGAPALLSLLHNMFHFSYPQMFAAGAVIAVGCLAVVLNNYRDPDAGTATAEGRSGAQY